MRRDVEFRSEGTTCRGWLTLPDAAPAKGKRWPAVVLAHGFSGTKDVRLDRVSEGFAAAGFAALAFDYRTTGSSDGEPRQHWVPEIQVADYRNAISFVRTLPEIDPERIGIWGSSFSGGHVIAVGSVDRRVRAIVTQVPYLDGRESVRKTAGEAAFREMVQQMIAERESIYAGNPPARLPVVSLSGEQAIIASEDAVAWFKLAAVPVANWKNFVTSPSVEAFLEYCPGALIERVSPTPLLMIVSDRDSVLPFEIAEAAFGRAREPKKMRVLSVGHFDVYEEPTRSIAVQEAVEWFRKYL